MIWLGIVFGCLVVGGMMYVNVLDIRSGRRERCLRNIARLEHELGFDDPTPYFGNPSPTLDAADAVLKDIHRLTSEIEVAKMVNRHVYTPGDVAFINGKPSEIVYDGEGNVFFPTA